MDSTGSFKVNAEFLRLEDGKVHLHKENGVKIAVPLDKLSTEDAQYVRQITGQPLEEPIPAEENKAQQQLVKLPVATKPTAPTAATASAAQPSIPDRPGSPLPATAPVQYNAQRYNADFDWFDFFFTAGINEVDSTRYAKTFMRERMDDSILPELDHAMLKRMGLLEGDIVRVTRFAASGSVKESMPTSQIDKDADYARRLQVGGVWYCCSGSRC